MALLLKNARIVNVFTDTVEPGDILIRGGMIVGVGDYSDTKADEIRDLEGAYVCPGFIDGHIHIESTMLRPEEFIRACVPHGTTAVVSDPHEIANVCGAAGIQYMLDASRNMPMTVYVMMPSCVPATQFDEAGAVLGAETIQKFYHQSRVLGLGEMMDYPGVVAGKGPAVEKLRRAKEEKVIINGHAPLLSGKELDRYISFGVTDDHECTNPEEARERIRKGQTIMIRQGTAARNLEALMPLFEEPWNRHCTLVTDDKHPADLLENGHIDCIVREAVRLGAPVTTAIRMATLQTARYYGLRNHGAVAPGHWADLAVLDDLDTVQVRDVYRNGVLVAKDGECLPFASPRIDFSVMDRVLNTVNLEAISPERFMIDGKNGPCRVIRLVPGQLLTDEWITDIWFDRNNGIDPERDILKIAVIERHHGTGHMGLGFVSGLGLRRGAIASTVSHDSHNVIAAGTNETDLALAVNELQEMGGGCIAVADGKVLARLELPVAGLMSLENATVTADKNEQLRRITHQELGVKEGIEPFMHLAFLSLPVIPDLKMTTLGLVNVTDQKIVPLFV